jgi:hypothetical protein
MKFWHSFAVTYLLCSSLISGLHGRSTTPPRALAQPQGAEKQLLPRLTTSVIAQRYCKEPGSDVSDNLRIRLRLRYTNVRSQALILYKHENTVFREMISRNPSEAAAHRYVWDFSLTTVTGGRDARIDVAVPSASFVILRPGQFFDSEAEVTIFVRRGRAGKESDGLLPGEYILQVSVSTWPESENLAERLRKRWQGIGTLSFRDLTSEPMRLKIDKRRKVVDCLED